MTTALLRPRYHPAARLTRWAAGRLRRLHRDDRGAMSVLVLLTVWCLVALLGLVWNTAEESARRQQMQNAADAAAHASATWVARAVNAVTAQNMVIAQDASTETIARAVPPTVTDVQGRIQREIDQIIAILKHPPPPERAKSARQAMLEQLRVVLSEGQLTFDALSALELGTGANFTGPEEAKPYLNELRQARSVLSWIDQTYLYGKQPTITTAPRRPGPPSAYGGLVDLINGLPDGLKSTTIYLEILTFLRSVEQPIGDGFAGQVAVAGNYPVIEQMAEHEREVFQNELAMSNRLTDDIEAQRDQLAAYYRADLTLAAPRAPVTGEQTGHTRIQSPLKPAAEVESQFHVDSIRSNLDYLDATLAAGLLPSVTIDPFNPHTDENRIWHPGIQASIPLEYLLKYPTLPDSKYHVKAEGLDYLGNPWGWWGHSWVAPLERYLYDRVNLDAAGLNRDYLVPLDLARSVTLAEIIRRLQGIPVNVRIDDLPTSLPDDQPAPDSPAPPSPPVYAQIPVLPDLSIPPRADAAYRAQVALYRQHGSNYTAAIRKLRDDIQNYADHYQTYTEAFASNAWHRHVNAARVTVARNLGYTRQFMVLKTYDLHFLPDWAKPAIRQSVATAAEQRIVAMNLRPVTRDILTTLVRADPLRLGGRYLDPIGRGRALRSAYTPLAVGMADRTIRPAAYTIAQEIADEWVSRPWPFEIAPPENEDTPRPGITRDDRLGLFTVVAAARATKDSAPRLLLQKIFNPEPTSLVAYAQAEAFNWLEYNSNFGGQSYEDVIPSPWLDGHFVGSPRSWRTGITAGWNWRARLTRADALSEALDNNDDLSQYFRDAGITVPDKETLDEINLH
jgi:hypothetical protein